MKGIKINIFQIMSIYFFFLISYKNKEFIDYHIHTNIHNSFLLAMANMSHFSSGKNVLSASGSTS
jgi:hypothetical protein